MNPAERDTSTDLSVPLRYLVGVIVFRNRAGAFVLADADRDATGRRMAVMPAVRAHLGEILGDELSWAATCPFPNDE